MGVYNTSANGKHFQINWKRKTTFFNPSTQLNSKTNTSNTFSPKKVMELFHGFLRPLELRLATYFATGHLVAVGSRSQVLPQSQAASSAAESRWVQLGRLQRLKLDPRWPIAARLKPQSKRTICWGRFFFFLAKKRTPGRHAGWSWLFDFFLSMIDKKCPRDCRKDGFHDVAKELNASEGRVWVQKKTQTYFVGESLNLVNFASTCFVSRSHFELKLEFGWTCNLIGFWLWYKRFIITRIKVLAEMALDLQFSSSSLNMLVAHHKYVELSPIPTCQSATHMVFKTSKHSK